MLPEQMITLGKAGNIIRTISAYGDKRRAEIGADKVYDFSIGNPNVPAPDCVKETILELLEGDPVALHSYTAAPGLPETRRAIADSLNRLYGLGIEPAQIYVTCGASGALAFCLKAILLPGDEVIASAPFYPEYPVYSEATGARFVALQPEADTFQLDLDALEAAITEKTKVLILNSPNNPSGVVLTADCMRRIADILRRSEARYGHTIYVLSDEPYRELVYGGIEVCSMLSYYDDTVLCYSFSKSLSIPGERMGYIALHPQIAERNDLFASICGAARVLGFINASTMYQKVIARCVDATADISQYEKNRNRLYTELEHDGFDCVHPDGAFYLFVKAPGGDSMAFYEAAKKYDILIVPSNDFGCPGYARLSYCVSPATIEGALPGFKRLAADYGLSQQA